MRVPQEWCDKNLLEDEPFFSAFKARQLAAPPNRRGAGPDGVDDDDDDARIEAIANEIRRMNLLSTVQAWLDLAFRPHYRINTYQRVKAEEPGMIIFFVKFYWALSHSYEDASGILWAARKEKCYGYFSEAEATFKSTTDLTKQVHPNQISQIGDGAFQSLSNEVTDSIPRDIEFQKNLNAKMDVPDSPEQDDESSSQTCPPFLDPISLSVTPQIEFNPFTQLPLPPDSRNTTAICDLPKKRKGRQVSPDRRRIKHRKFNETTSDTSKLCNVSQARNDVIDEKTKARHSQRGDIADHVSDGQPPFKNLRAKKNVPNCPEPKGKSSSQTCPPFLDPTSSSATPQIESIPSSTQLPLPTDSRNATAICNLPKKRKGHQVSPDRRRIKHRKINEATSDTGKLCNVSQARNDVFDKKAKARLSQCEVVSDKAIPVSDGALCGQPPLQKVLGRIPPGLKFKKISSAKKDVPDCPEQEGISSSQTCPPSLEPTSLSATGVIEFISSASPSPPDSQNTTDLPKPRKRQTSPDTPRKKHRGVNEATLDASKLVDNNNPEPPQACRIEWKEDKLKIICQPVASSTSESTRIKLNETVLFPSNAPDPTDLAKNKRPQKVKEEQESSASVTVQPVPGKKRRGRPPKVKEGREGSASLTVQPVPRWKKDLPLKSQDQLDAGTVVPFSGQNVGVTQETSNIPFSLAQSSHAVFGLQDGFSRHDFLPLLDRCMKEETNLSENWLLTHENVLVEEEGFIFEDPAATQMENCPTNIFPAHKPPLCVNPPIWAQSRQEVCETFDWFRSYQGGVYFAHNAVKGYLLSAFSSKRDRFEHDGKLIISHGGGKSESLHTRKGQTTTQPAADQLAQDKSVRALLDNYRNQRPLALLIDDKYALFPYDLGVKDITYVVLGFYTIAHAWAEFQPTTNGGHVVRYKFAFRWCDNQGSPWWLTEKETNLSELPPPSIPTAFSSEPIPKRKPRKLLNRGEKGAVLHTTMVREAVSHGPKSFVCRICHMDSPHVYTWAWLCLQPDCSGFWKDIKGNYAPDNLEYDLDFLKLMASLPVPPDFGKLRPDPPARLSTDGTVTSYAFTRGYHCNSCGRLSCRVKWEKWECSNCKECLPVSRPPHKAKDFWSNLLPIGYKDHSVSKKSKIEQQPVRSFRHENGMGSIQSFILPEGRGKIHHIQPGTPLGRLEADDIFIEYQQQATAGELKFRRWPLRSHKCRGALLTNYFSQNCGEPYQYVGGTANTVPFESAPSAVVKARALIQKRVQQALGKLVEFNEILSAAYMERQKMAFHSDNEIGLGPVVAGLSLGSPALMHFRINAKYDRLKELKGNLLSFVLRHGDVLVMDGASVQEYYEHTVIPNNFRIAATARHITPGHA